MIPYSRPKRSDLYTLSKSKQLENHTPHRGTYYIAHMWQCPPPLLREKPLVPGYLVGDNRWVLATENRGPEGTGGDRGKASRWEF